MILHTTPTAYIISHPDSVKYTVPQTDNNDQVVNQNYYQLTRTLFEIHKPFINNTHTNLDALAVKLESVYKSEIVPYFDKRIVDNAAAIDNSIAVKTAQELFSQMDSVYEKFHGANATGSVVVTKFKDKVYLFPPNCRFFNCDLFVEDGVFLGVEKFDLVVMDPPWKNKFIKRRKGNCMGYDTHSTESIEKLRLGSILKPDAIVAIWSTNSKTEKILGDMMKKWGLVHLTTFYWLKVTTSGRVTVPFTKKDGKQPFESLIIATNNSEIKSHINYPMRIIVSTPSAINSHKPPLTDVLEDYFQREFTSKCELFARYLLPDYTSIGNQGSTCI
ncbi:N(6)-adenine-specific methyltransferase METTL4 isoform X2 [Folsomia candida]|uniref:N(6)-adenine-specific methyltransferase METTL4 isoform X2 n=1 Tax=Folsomia candida TaxID=158441 RepID=UPI001604C6E7|nr:N(6)-adenine-specific methyltransferase METTL4 isoform X2 [Folsomia candida]